MKQSTVRLLGSVAVLCLITGVASSQEPAAELDFGTLESSVYTNEYFGLELTIPSEWSVLDKAAQQRLTDVGGELIAGDDENLQAIIKASEMQTVNLVGAFKHPLGYPVPYNPSIMCVAERIEGLPGIGTGRDYHYHAKRLLQAGQLDVSFPTPMSADRLGGEIFDVLHVQMEILGLTVRQDYYARITDGYALLFIASYTTEDEKAELDGVLRSITFD